jgi:hypothetical protein
MITSLLFTIQITARPENVGDGNNERYIAQAFAANGEALSTYRGEGHTLSTALRELAKIIDKKEHPWAL